MLEIEITEEMIAAGIDAFSGYYPDTSCDGEYARSAIAAILASALKRIELAPASLMHGADVGGNVMGFDCAAVTVIPVILDCRTGPSEIGRLWQPRTVIGHALSVLH